MRFPQACLAVAIALSMVTPASAQWFDSMINPDVEVSLTHPPSLGVKVQRVAFAPVTNRAEEALVSACIEDLLATGQVEVLDRGHIERVIREHSLSTASLGDARSAQALGRLLGFPILLTVSVPRPKVTRTPHSSTKAEWKDSHGKVYPAVTTYTAKTQIDYRASVQTVDLASGRIYSQQRIAVAPSREQSAEDLLPEYPSEREVLEMAIDQARTQVHRMLLPWTEIRKLIFYDDQDFGMKEAYKRLKLKDVFGALDASRAALAKAKANPGTKPKYLGRTNYNVGICYFILGDYPAAMPFLRGARETDQGHKLFREALAECERAIQLREEMTRVETDSARSEPSSKVGEGSSAAPGATIEERLERLEALRKKGLITQGEYDQRRAEILREL